MSEYHREVVLPLMHKVEAQEATIREWKKRREQWEALNETKDEMIAERDATIAELEENINIKADFIEKAINNSAADAQTISELRELVEVLNAEINTTHKAETTSDKLKPCPFCGSAGSVYRDHCADAQGVFLTVKCRTCGAKSGEKYHSIGNDCPQTYQEARDVWNTRAQSPAEELVKAMEKIHRRMDVLETFDSVVDQISGDALAAHHAAMGETK